jgi:hypothetical protein
MTLELASKFIRQISGEGESAHIFLEKFITTQGKNLEDEQCQQREVLKNRGEKCPAF